MTYDTLYEYAASQVPTGSTGTMYEPADVVHSDRFAASTNVSACAGGASAYDLRLLLVR